MIYYSYTFNNCEVQVMRSDQISKTEQMLQLFKLERARPERSATLLPVQIRYCLVPSQNQYMISLELLAGTKKKYQVTQPEAFLTSIVTRQFFSISKTTFFDPAIHYISPALHDIAQMLLQMLEAEPLPPRAKHILIPPAWYFRMATSLLAYHDIMFEYYLPAGPLDEQLQRFDKLIQGDGKLPLTINVSGQHMQYWLRCDHIHELVVLPAYEAAVMRGQWYNVSHAHGKQLQFIQSLLIEHEEWNIEPQYIGTLLDLALPQLNKIVSVVLDASVTAKVIQHPLQAQLFLDRVNNRLLVGLEFHYGSLFINPLLPEEQQLHADHIVLREREKEADILNLINELPSLQTEGGWIIEGDEDEYYFFHTLLPKLKQQSKVFATTAVRLRYVSEDVYPNITLSWEEKSNWLQYSFSMKGISNDELRQVLEALQIKRSYVRLSDGALLSLEHEKFTQLIKVMNELGLQHPTRFDDRIPLRRAIGYIQALPDQTPIKLSRSLKKFVDHIQHPEHYAVPVPSQLQVTLRDYQIDGFQWMSLLADHGLGGLLADEMGLGKTIQVIAFLTSRLPEIIESGEKALIAVPASLLYNWQNEFERFSPETKAVVLEARTLPKALLNEHSEHTIGQAQVMIVSYQALRQHIKTFAAHQYHTFVCDEAQAFKNDYTQTSRAVKLIQARNRFALTGTPIENRLDELWSIMNMVNPNTFIDKQTFLEWPRETLLARIAPFMLRRKKSEVIEELPAKIETTIVTPLLPEQKKLYLAYLAQLQEDTLKHLSPQKRGQTRIKLLAGMTRLRQICCHPSLFVDRYTGGSAKLDQLLQLVDDSYREGKRLLIFSQFTSMLDIIAQHLAVKGYTHFRIDGSTPPLERIQQCDDFNNGERDLFLLSLKAGGTGLNLTGADTVILYDLWWNPAVEQQASDRVHRIGQRNVVNIIKLISEGTLEDKMLQLQYRKQQLIDDILEVDEGLPGSWDPEEIIALLAPDDQFLLDEEE